MLKEIWVKNGEKKSVEQEYYPSFFWCYFFNTIDSFFSGRAYICKKINKKCTIQR